MVSHSVNIYIVLTWDRHHEGFSICHSFNCYKQPSEACTCSLFIETGPHCLVQAGLELLAVPSASASQEGWNYWESHCSSFYPDFSMERLENRPSSCDLNVAEAEFQTFNKAPVS